MSEILTAATHYGDLKGTIKADLHQDDGLDGLRTLSRVPAGYDVIGVDISRYVRPHDRDKSPAEGRVCLIAANTETGDVIRCDGDATFADFLALCKEFNAVLVLKRFAK